MGSYVPEPYTHTIVERDVFIRKNVWYFDEKLTGDDPSFSFDDTTSLNYDVLNCKGLQ